MSSSFVSGGTIDKPIERDDAWLEAQKEIEANRARKAALARPTDGRSLFETLEANKAAKQDAFEEANKIKNQFRSLDADEIDFLDSVLESTRAEEDKIKKETREGLELFRRQQDEADKKARQGETAVASGSPVEDEEQWAAAGRKRKRTKDKEVLRGVKIRRASTTEENTAKSATTVIPPSSKASPTNKQQPSSTPAEATKKIAQEPSPASISKPSTAPPKPGLALVDYGSDEDDW